MSDGLHRRSLLGFLTAMVLSPCGAVAARLRRGLPRNAEASAIAKGKALGVGTIRREGPRSVEVLSHPYYYVRVVQTDGEEAISSPIWINCAP